MIVSLKCPNCGAGLEIGPDLQNLACGYCGCSSRVVRSGGTVSLCEVYETLNDVAANTDRTASELALVRLEAELETLSAQLQENKIHGFDSINGKWENIPSLWDFAKTAAPLIVVAFILGLVTYPVLCVILALAAAGVQYIAWRKIRDEIEFKNMNFFATVKNTQTDIETKIATVRKQILEHRFIVKGVPLEREATSGH